MKTFVFGFLATAGIAVSAQAAFGFSYQFSTDNGATWGNSRTISIHSGDSDVRFRVVAYATPGTTVSTVNGTGPAVAFGRLTGSEKLTNWGAHSGDMMIGSMTRGEMSSGGVTYLASSTSSGNTILGSNVVTSFASQLLVSGVLASYCPSSGGAPDYQWIVRTGTIRVGAADGVRTIGFGNNTRLQNTWYYDNLINGVQDVNTATPNGVAIDINGTLNVIPAPGTLLLTGLAGLAAVRRRRA